MEYIKTDQEFPVLFKSAVTLGKFDGVHRGHKKLIDQILERKKTGEKAVMLAFVSDKPTLLSAEERRHYLEKTGIDVLLECPLTENFCSKSAETFIQEILVDKLHTSFVAVGEDFRFGFQRMGTTETLKEYGKKFGFETAVLKKEMDGDRKVSSTYIKEELLVGNMEKVEELLGRPFVVEGEVLHGRGMGHKNFFPTANLVPPATKLMPPNGVYATRSRFQDQVYTGITNVGYKPTVGETFLGVETYLFQCDRDLYGEYCQVELKSYQRPELKFSSFEELKAQIGNDIKKGQAFFSEMSER